MSKTKQTLLRWLQP